MQIIPRIWMHLLRKIVGPRFEPWRGYHTSRHKMKLLIPVLIFIFALFLSCTRIRERLNDEMLFPVEDFELPNSIKTK